jgi:cold shock CspA family protein
MGATMNDQILGSYISTFAVESDLASLPQDDLFEHFANFTIVSKLFGQQVDPLDVHTGTAFGIDGIAIFVNDQPVLGADEVEELSRHRLDAHFVFIQAKNSSTFDLGGMLKFFEAVKIFFGPEATPGDSEQLGRFRQAKLEIYKKSIKMEIAPVCELYYVTCGKWTDDPLLLKGIDQAKESLRATGLFSEVKFTPVDAEKLKSYYRALKQQVVKQITFEKYAVIPRMVDVDQAYIGVLPAKEYLKLITDADGNLERNLFYDNVRDFQGDNSVNTEISQSIRAALPRQDKFAILNNGITIVAREIRPIGTEFTIRDYQVVNGCQTSHVLFFNRAFVSDGLFIPIKLISTSSQDVANLVIKATNRQTEIKEEAFAALEPFHKRLEEFYASFNDPSIIRLFYERRSRQYDRDNISQARIISVAAQTKAWVAMFSGEPHNAHHYYGELLKTYWQGKKVMYQDEHDEWPYFASGYSFSAVDKLLRTPSLAKFRPFRSHLLDLLGRRYFGNEPHLVFKQPAKVIAKQCQQLMEFWRQSNASDEVKELLRFIDACFVKVGRGEPRWDATQRRDFTEVLVNTYRQERGVKASTPTVETPAASRVGRRFTAPRTKGTIKRSGSEFGFIVDSSGQDVFYHRSSVLDLGFALPQPGASVEFTKLIGPRGLKAVDIVVLS